MRSEKVAEMVKNEWATEKQIVAFFVAKGDKVLEFLRAVLRLLQRCRAAGFAAAAVAPSAQHIPISHRPRTHSIFYSNTTFPHITSK